MHATNHEMSKLLIRLINKLEVEYARIAHNEVGLTR